MVPRFFWWEGISNIEQGMSKSATHKVSPEGWHNPSRCREAPERDHQETEAWRAGTRRCVGPPDLLSRTRCCPVVDTTG